MGTLVAELEDLERRGWQALSSSAGADFYSEVMADDGLMVFPGMVLDKQAALDAIKAAAPWSSFELIELRVIDLGQDSGVIIYRAAAQRRNESIYEAWMSSVYVRRGDRWLLVLHQQSP